MRHLARAAGGLATIVALLALMAGTALAGNFAEVTYVDAGEEPPTAGEERDITFVLLQHGVAPIDVGDVELVLVHGETGERMTATATPMGDGLWRATVTFPSAGAWEIGVRHQWFETSEPVAISVGEASTVGWMRPAAAIGAFGAAVALLAVMLLVRRPRLAIAAPAEGVARARG